MMRPYKFVVQAVVQECDEAGNVTGEAAAEPVTIYGTDVLAVWATTFAERLAEQQTKSPSPNTSGECA